MPLPLQKSKITIKYQTDKKQITRLNIKKTMKEEEKNIIEFEDDFEVVKDIYSPNFINAQPINWVKIQNLVEFKLNHSGSNQIEKINLLKSNVKLILSNESENYGKMIELHALLKETINKEKGPFKADSHFLIALTSIKDQIFIEMKNQQYKKAVGNTQKEKNRSNSLKNSGLMLKINEDFIRISPNQQRNLLMNYLNKMEYKRPKTDLEAVEIIISADIHKKTTIFIEANFSEDQMIMFENEAFLLASAYYGIENLLKYQLNESIPWEEWKNNYDFTYKSLKTIFNWVVKLGYNLEDVFLLKRSELIFLSSPVLSFFIKEKIIKLDPNKISLLDNHTNENEWNEIDNTLYIMEENQYTEEFGQDLSIKFLLIHEKFKYIKPFINWNHPYLKELNEDFFVFLNEKYLEIDKHESIYIKQFSYKKIFTESYFQNLKKLLSLNPEHLFNFIKNNQKKHDLIREASYIDQIIFGKMINEHFFNFIENFIEWDIIFSSRYMPNREIFNNSLIKLSKETDEKKLDIIGKALGILSLEKTNPEDENYILNLKENLNPNEIEEIKTIFLIKNAKKLENHSEINSPFLHLLLEVEGIRDILLENKEKSVILYKSKYNFPIKSYLLNGSYNQEKLKKLLDCSKFALNTLTSIEFNQFIEKTNFPEKLYDFMIDKINKKPKESEKLFSSINFQGALSDYFSKEVCSFPKETYLDLTKKTIEKMFIHTKRLSNKSIPDIFEYITDNQFSWNFIFSLSDHGFKNLRKILTKKETNERNEIINEMKKVDKETLKIWLDKKLFHKDYDRSFRIKENKINKKNVSFNIEIKEDLNKKIQNHRMFLLSLNENQINALYQIFKNKNEYFDLFFNELNDDFEDTLRKISSFITKNGSELFYFKIKKFIQYKETIKKLSIPWKIIFELEDKVFYVLEKLINVFDCEYDSNSIINIFNQVVKKNEVEFIEFVKIFLNKMDKERKQFHDNGDKKLLDNYLKSLGSMIFAWNQGDFFHGLERSLDDNGQKLLNSPEYQNLIKMKILSKEQAILLSLMGFQIKKWGWGNFLTAEALVNQIRALGIKAKPFKLEHLARLVFFKEMSSPEDNNAKNVPVIPENNIYCDEETSLQEKRNWIIPNLMEVDKTTPEDQAFWEMRKNYLT